MNNEPSSDLAVAAIFAAATNLPLDGAQELARRITEWVVVQIQNHHHDLHPLAAVDARFIGGLRAVTEVVGHPPTSQEYLAEYERRRGLGDSGLPSVSAVSKHFDGWPYALAAAGLTSDVAPTGIQRRRARTQKIVHRYTEARLAECLRACAADLGRVPMVRDFVVWREELIAGRPGRRATATDVPHHRTYYGRYHGWDAALAAAGLDGHRQSRTERQEYTDLSRER